MTLQQWKLQNDSNVLQCFVPHYSLYEYVCELSNINACFGAQSSLQRVCL